MEIDGYDGNYLVFSYGLVFSKRRMIFLKQFDGHGYKYVNLYRNKKGNKFSIHRLIGQYFIPNPNNYPVIDHIDRNKQNNDINNLRWTTIRENTINQKQRKSKSGHLGVSLVEGRYTAILTLSSTFNTIPEAIEYRNTLFKEFKRNVRKDMTGIQEKRQNKYKVTITINKSYKTLEETIEGRKQFELKYRNN